MIYGRSIKNIFPSNKQGATIKNFDFIFCDFIKHPKASNNKDNISHVTSTTAITLKLTKKMEDTIFSKLLI